MRAFELAVAAVLAAGGVRSLVVWSRRAVGEATLREHLWFAAFVTGRVGLWLSLAGLFAISAASDARGRAFLDELAALRWYALVPLLLAAVQVAAGYFLGRGEG
ncbi:MAG: hypothetical protein KatS3mg014_1757 [Actinomycetota bacterium]|nr:MAG: hypothetical protein KatS3mg014_1757 [Actinomycetota bacterium]